MTVKVPLIMVRPVAARQNISKYLNAARAARRACQRCAVE